MIGEEERDRLEAQWNSRFRKGGSGKVVVAESALRVQLLAHSMGDLAALADMKATKEDVCNAFHVPISFLSSETNLANLQAAEHQHMSKAVTPRLQRRDEKLNEQLLPLYDPTGRLFLASEDPVPVNREQTAKEQELNLKYGVTTINEVRGVQGLAPVPWGDVPWLPRQWARTDDTGRTDAKAAGRSRPQEDGSVGGATPETTWRPSKAVKEVKSRSGKAFRRAATPALVNRGVKLPSCSFRRPLSCLKTRQSGVRDVAWRHGSNSRSLVAALETPGLRR